MNRARRTVIGSAGALGVGAALGGCSWLARPSPVPMDQQHDDRACPTTLAPVLLVMLPGRYMPLAEIGNEGLVDALRRRGIAADVTLVDSHIGYVDDRSVMRRLQAEVLLPARAAGYRRLWLAGISLGAWLALHCARLHPGAVEGIFAIAPYLGREALVQAVADAGGARNWVATGADARAVPGAPQPVDPMRRGLVTDPAAPAAWTEGAAPEADVDALLWRWLVDATANPTAAAQGPAIWLGHGRDDRYAFAQRQLAALLPADRVLVAPGGHDWAPWRALWSQWLDRGALPRACTA